MKKIYFLLLATFSFTCSAFSQSIDQNYLHTRTMLTADETGYTDKIEYFDGIGRPVETVFKIASPLKKDIATMQEYDLAGRHSYTWLLVPIDDSSGKYVDAGLFKLKAKNSSIYQNDPYPHSKTEYEPSPLNRVKSLIPAGADWFGGGNAVDYYWSTNDVSYSKCYDYQITNDNYSFQNKGLYAPNKLFKTSEYDEDNHRTEIFTNSLKQVVLKRVFSGSPHDTYYIYDDFDNLRYVVPPAAVDLLSETNISWNILNNQAVKDFVYYYEYDEKNNCIKKKLPGCDPIQMKYDRADRLIFSQNGNQKLKNEWTFFLYDVFGRQTVSGIWKSGNVPETKDLVVKTDYTGSVSLGGYTVNLNPLPAIHLLTVNYYDSYNLFISDQTGINANKLKYTVLSGYDEPYVSSSPSGDLGGLNAKGMLTGTRTYQLDDPTKYTVSAIYYDHRGRVVQTHTSNHMGGFEDEYFALTFTGKVKQRQHVHSIPGKTTQTEFYTYTYDHAERLRSVIHKINNATAVTFAQYSYDEIGRLLTKKLATETSTYKYNIRSWLTQIEGSKFNQTLAYCSPVNGLSPEDAYNGNIGAMKWKAGDETTERGYALIYDELNRLTAALYGEGTNIRTNLNRYNELLSYDKMGNIKTLQRQGKLDSGYGEIDNLTYTYNGNRLTKVSDAVTTPITNAATFHFVDGANQADEYTYDANGNLMKDLNKKITSITYNVLNLPSVITFNDGKTITYGYDASGSKLSVTYNMGNGVVSKMEYAGNKVYKNGTLGTILTEEGYVTMDGSTPKYHYFLKDHQGNNRVVIDQAGTVEQVNHYYPFGGLFGEGSQESKQPYKYNGKEFDRTMDLDMYDFHWRQYMADLGRTTTLDPHAENYYNLSSYSMFANNPVRYIDPDGRDWYEYSDKDGNFQTMWRKSQDKTYKDGSGNIWNNIGENYLSINGDNATLFTQHKNDKGELYLRSSSYNLGNEKSANTLTSTLGDILSKGSAVTGALGGYAEGSNATFRLTNSKGALDFKFYGNGWKGNQWVTPSSMSNLGKVVQRAGRVAGYAGIFVSGSQFIQATTMESKLEHGFDAFMGGMGFIPVVGPGISLYWGFGGKQLHYNWVDKVLMPQMQMGIHYYPSVQPFK